MSFNKKQAIEETDVSSSNKSLYRQKGKRTRRSSYRKEIESEVAPSISIEKIRNSPAKRVATDNSAIRKMPRVLLKRLPEIGKFGVNLKNNKEIAEEKEGVTSLVIEQRDNARKRKGVTDGNENNDIKVAKTLDNIQTGIKSFDENKFSLDVNQTDIKAAKDRNPDSEAFLPRFVMDTIQKRIGAKENEAKKSRTENLNAGEVTSNQTYIRRLFDTYPVTEVKNQNTTQHDTNIQNSIENVAKCGGNNFARFANNNFENFHIVSKSISTITIEDSPMKPNDITNDKPVFNRFSIDSIKKDIESLETYVAENTPVAGSDSQTKKLNEVETLKQTYTFKYMHNSSFENKNLDQSIGNKSVTNDIVKNLHRNGYTDKEYSQSLQETLTTQADQMFGNAFNPAGFNSSSMSQVTVSNKYISTVSGIHSPYTEIPCYDPELLVTANKTTFKNSNFQNEPQKCKNNSKRLVTSITETEQSILQMAGNGQVFANYQNILPSPIFELRVDNSQKIFDSDMVLDVEDFSHTKKETIDPLVIVKKYSNFFQFPYIANSPFRKSRGRNKRYDRIGHQRFNLSLDSVKQRLEKSDIEHPVSAYELGDSVTLDYYPISTNEVECYHRILGVAPLNYPEEIPDEIFHTKEFQLCNSSWKSNYKRNEPPHHISCNLIDIIQEILKSKVIKHDTEITDENCPVNDARYDLEPQFSSIKETKNLPQNKKPNNYITVLDDDSKQLNENPNSSIENRIFAVALQEENIIKIADTNACAKKDHGKSSYNTLHLIPTESSKNILNPLSASAKDIRDSTDPEESKAPVSLSDHHGRPLTLSLEKQHVTTNANVFQSASNLIFNLELPDLRKILEEASKIPAKLTNESTSELLQVSKNHIENNSVQSYKPFEFNHISNSYISNQSDIEDIDLPHSKHSSVAKDILDKQEENESNTTFDNWIEDFLENINCETDAENMTVSEILEENELVFPDYISKWDEIMERKALEDRNTERLLKICSLAENECNTPKSDNFDNDFVKNKHIVFESDVKRNEFSETLGAKEDEFEYPEYKSKWEKIMERKASKDNKVMENLLKDCSAENKSNITFSNLDNDFVSNIPEPTVSESDVENNAFSEILGEKKDEPKYPGCKRKNTMKTTSLEVRENLLKDCSTENKSNITFSNLDNDFVSNIPEPTVSESDVENNAFSEILGEKKNEPKYPGCKRKNTMKTKSLEVRENLLKDCSTENKSNITFSNYNGFVSNIPEPTVSESDVENNAFSEILGEKKDEPKYPGYKEQSESNSLKERGQEPKKIKASMDKTANSPVNGTTYKGINDVNENTSKEKKETGNEFDSFAADNNFTPSCVDSAENCNKASDKDSTQKFYGNRVTNRGTFLTKSSKNIKTIKIPKKNSVEKPVNSPCPRTEEFHRMVKTPNIQLELHPQCLKHKTENEQVLNFQKKELRNKNSHFNAQFSTSYVQQTAAPSTNLRFPGQSNFHLFESRNSQPEPVPFQQCIPSNPALMNAPALYYHNNDVMLNRNHTFSNVHTSFPLPDGRFTDKPPLLNNPYLYSANFQAPMQNFSPNINPGCFSKPVQPYELPMVPKDNILPPNPLMFSSNNGTSFSPVLDELTNSDLASSVTSPSISNTFYGTDLSFQTLQNSVPSPNLSFQSQLNTPLISQNWQLYNTPPTNQRQTLTPTDKKAFCLVPPHLKKLVGHSTVETDNVRLLILEWDFSNFMKQQENPNSPPISNSSLKKVVSSYDNFEDHYNTYFPLLMLETWQRIYISWADLGQALPKIFNITSYAAKSTYVNVICQSIVNTAVHKGIYPDEGSILMIDYGTKSNNFIIKILGYVTNVKSRRFNKVTDSKYCNFPLPQDGNLDAYRVITMSYMGAYNTEDIDILLPIQVHVLCNVKATLKQNDAMLYLVKSPMLKNILNPVEDGLRCIDLIPRHSSPENVLKCLTNITKGISSRHLLPVFTVVRAGPQSDHLNIIPLLISRIKNEYETKVLLCVRSPRALSDIAANICLDPSLKLVIVNKRSDTLPHLKKYLLDSLVEAEQRSTKESESMLKILNSKTETVKHVRNRILKDSDVVLTLIRNCYDECLASALEENDCIGQTCCIIEEASLCTEPETLIPFLHGIDKFIFVGDPNCKAKVLSYHAKSYDYTRSLFHRAHDLHLITEKLF